MAADNERRFGGIDRLYGAGSVGRLAQAHVAVIGIGGVGSWAAEALARSGVGRLTLVDLDHVAESNINRQCHALSATLGQAKVQAMAARIAEINPDCRVALVEEFVTADEPGRLIPADALVVDAIDQIKAKAALIACCRTRGQALVTTGGAGGKTDPTQIRVTDLAQTTHDALAASLRAELRRHHDFPRQGPFGIECVHSIEAGRRPAEACTTAPGSHGLNCAGYGSSVCVTASFGFAAASRALLAILHR
jgi:tRNA A37 threonylcarbamoyladenosine dehydratase